METFELGVYNAVGSSLCIEADDGQKLYEQIAAALRSGKKVVLSFQNVEMITSAFLNSAIGQLYRDFSEDAIKESLSVSDMDGADETLLKRVVETAKIFYKEPGRLEKSLHEIA